MSRFADKTPTSVKTQSVLPVPTSLIGERMHMKKPEKIDGDGLFKLLIKHLNRPNLDQSQRMQNFTDDLNYHINDTELIDQSTINEFILFLNERIRLIKEGSEFISIQKTKDVLQLYIDALAEIGEIKPPIGETTLNFKQDVIAQIKDEVSSLQTTKTPGGNKRKKKSNKNRPIRRKSIRRKSRKSRK